MINFTLGQHVRVFAGPKVTGQLGKIVYMSSQCRNFTVELLENGGKGFEKGTSVRVDRLQLSPADSVTIYEK